MTTALEADVTFLNVRGGVQQADRPLGFAVRAAPRRAARSRNRDLLFLALHLRSGVTPSPEWYQALLDLAVARYFASPGSVTSAIREMAAAVNADLLQFNLRNAAGSAHVQAGLMAAVLRSRDLYLAQIGAGAALAIHPAGLERFPSEPQSEGRPLGVGQSFEAQFFHTQADEGELLILSPHAPASWDGATLAGLAGLALPIVVSRLERTGGSNAAALIARLVPAGAVTSLPEAMTSKRPSLPIPLPPLPLPGRAARRAAPPPTAPIVEPPASVAQPPAPVNEPPEWEDEEFAQPTWRWRLGVTLRRWRHRVEAAPLGRWRAALARRVMGLLGALARGARMLLSQILPQGTLSPNGEVRLPASLLVATAVGLPFVIGLLSAGIYIQRGRGLQYDEYLRQAQLSAALARTQPDAASARPYWEAALDWAARAESARSGTEEVARLRDEGQAALDALDLVTRLAFAPTLPDGFGRGANITRLFVHDDDVYALNATSQSIARVTRSVEGYGLDQEFKCAGGLVGGYTVGPIVDMLWLPGPNVVGSDALLAMDNLGVLLLCTPGGESPLSVELVPPDAGWAAPAAVDLFGDRLYVLDAGANQIWQYQQASGLFALPPAPYFTSTAYDLSQAIDFTISGSGDVFLLRGDGRIAFCSRESADVSGVCLENMPYSDPRPGRTGGERLADLRRPAGLVFDPPPEPSLYLLDADLAGVFQLSLKLALQQQFRPAEPLPAPMAAVAIGFNKELYVAAGDNVYVAPRP